MILKLKHQVRHESRKKMFNGGWKKTRFELKFRKFFHQKIEVLGKKLLKLWISKTFFSRLLPSLSAQLSDEMCLRCLYFGGSQVFIQVDEFLRSQIFFLHFF